MTLNRRLRTEQKQENKHMSQSPFSAPAPPGSGIKWESLNGSLLLIEPIAVKTGISTAYGESDAVEANVYVLDGQEQGEEYPSALVFPKLLQSQLSSQIGQKVLGRLGQGTAKPGQSPPWLLQPATDQDQQVGMQWLQQRQNAVSQPAPAQGQPNQWPQQGQQGQGGGTVPF